MWLSGTSSCKPAAAFHQGQPSQRSGGEGPGTAELVSLPRARTPLHTRTSEKQARAPAGCLTVVLAIWVTRDEHSASHRARGLRQPPPSLSPERL